jgi:hypothetical protein
MFSSKLHNFVFFMTNIPWCVCIHYFIYLFTDSWAPWLIPLFSCCEQRCNKCRYFSCILIYTPLDICPRVVQQDRLVSVILVFWGSSILTFTVVVLGYIPTNSVCWFFFPCILVSICCYLFSWWLQIWLQWDEILV